MVALTGKARIRVIPSPRNIIDHPCFATIWRPVPNKETGESSGDVCILEINMGAEKNQYKVEIN